MSTQNPLQVELVPVARLFLNPANPRRNDAAVPHVVASVKRFGWRQPIVAKRSGEVIAGNTRLKAAHTLNVSEVPVVWFDGSDLDATAYAIADNRTHEFSEWDPPALTKLLEELRAEDSLDGVGYTTADIDALVLELENGAESGGDVDDPGPEKPPKQPVTRSGDLWILGRHRLLCGDSTNAADVARVLAGEKASLMATDPPYCVGYTGADRPNDSGKDWSDTYDEVSIKDLGEFMRGLLRATLPHLIDTAAIYVSRSARARKWLTALLAVNRRKFSG